MRWIFFKRAKTKVTLQGKMPENGERGEKSQDFPSASLQCMLSKHLLYHFSGGHNLILYLTTNFD